MFHKISRLLQSFSKNYKDQFKIKNLRNFRRFNDIRIIGIGGSSLGTKTIYSFLKGKIKKNISFYDNLSIFNKKSGNKREGNVKQLINHEKLCNYKIVKPQPLSIKKQIISSSLLRKYLQSGKINNVNKLLNRRWSIDGKVQKGRQLGKKIGFPTANIDIKDYVLAKPGVYAVKAKKIKSSKYIKGIANLGYRPTFNGKKILLEVHLFNFSGNLYNKYLRVEFLKFIRAEKKFRNVDQLKKQIKIDLITAKKTK